MVDGVFLVTNGDGVVGLYYIYNDNGLKKSMNE